ncbi:MAG: hypothetical protein EKK40_08040 [Bradyrhizobiaceae bacterium]|nr:MAG: hypothetical protein EKK40_08040 [Bradyrhizobiaceae bacterium]
MTSQKQNAGGGTAIQAGRDVTIQSGVSPADMIRFMEMVTALHTFALDAERKANERYESFRNEILKKFSSENGEADSSAFRDPDFQMMLGDAQTEYVRSGDESLRDTLIDIIARRSLEKERSRRSLTLNEAVKKAPSLTRNEIAGLSFVYLFRYVTFPAGNLAHLIGTFEKNFLPLKPDITTSDSSFDYIAAQGCGSVEMGELPAHHILSESYGGLLGMGFTEDALTARFPEGRIAAFDELRIICVNDQSKIQFNARNLKAFENAVMKIDPTIEKGKINSAWALMTESIQIFDMMKRIAHQSPEVGELFEMWDKSNFKHMRLNAVGIAIAHANARRVANFDAPLDIWIS